MPKRIVIAGVFGTPPTKEHEVNVGIDNDAEKGDVYVIGGNEFTVSDKRTENGSCTLLLTPKPKSNP